MCVLSTPHLITSWEVFHCVSQLELAQFVGTGVKTWYLTSGNISHTGNTYKGARG